MEPNDIDISDLLTISCERKPLNVDGGATCLRWESPSGRFSRIVQLPFSVDHEAHFENGVLQADDLAVRPHQRRE